MTSRQSGVGGMPGGNPGLSDAGARARVLARRRMALIGLAGAAIITLLIAIVTGSWPILAASLLFDVLLAGYVAILLQIKQQQAAVITPQPTARGSDVRVYGS